MIYVFELFQNKFGFSMIIKSASWWDIFSHNPIDQKAFKCDECLII